MGSPSLSLLAITIFIGLLCPALSDPPGFLSINCGASRNETDEKGLTWIADNLYVENREAMEFPEINTSRSRYQSVAYFTNMQVNKYCYRLPVKPGTLYLVRARFIYGGLKDKEKLATSFDLLIGGIRLAKVNLTEREGNKSSHHEIILSPKIDTLSLCLARNSETVADRYVSICTIELRPLESSMYSSLDFEEKALRKINRWNFGEATENVEYKDDPFDRVWNPKFSDKWRVVPNSSLPLESLNGNGTRNSPPVQVLQTAVTTRKVKDNLSIPMAALRDFDDEPLSQSYYFALYLCGINETSNKSFQALVNTVNITDWLQFPSFLQCKSTENTLEHNADDTLTLTLRPRSRSDIGVFINAAEVFKILDIQNSTHPGDVLAVRNIAKAMNVPDDWTGGDPCLPVGYPLTGINCSEDNPRRVIAINLTNMGLNGSITPIIENLTALTMLLLGNNNFSGSIPDLSSLKNLTTLQLQNNNLTVEIPRSLERLFMLKQLYLQKNKLETPIPEGLIERWRNGSLDLRYDEEKRKRKSWVIGVSIACSVTFIAVVISLTLIWKYKHRLRIQTTNRPITFQQDPYTDEENQHAHHRLAVEYSEDDLKKATNNYSTIIGKGGFGFVFYGKLSGYDVAVKILSTDSTQGQQEFQNEVTFLSRIYHKNLVNLIGYCRQPSLALVYEYMQLGTLKDHLYGMAKLEKPLDWPTRLNIALQAAQGLLYLHQGCNPPIIHRDIKCNNILLDKTMSAKLADFGLSRLLDSSYSYISTLVKGTPGYLDPEYFETSYLTQKSDVYSFGVVLLEIISGISPKEGIVESARKLLSRGRLEDLMDPSLNNQYNVASAWKVAEIAYTCAEPKSINRPNTNVLVKELEEAVALELQHKNQSSHLRVDSFDTADMPRLR